MEITIFGLKFHQDLFLRVKFKNKLAFVKVMAWHQTSAKP